MSYSFNIKAISKEVAKLAVLSKFEEVVVRQQPVHARDRAAVLSNVNAVVDLLADDNSKDVSVSVNGYVSWSDASGEEPAFSTVSISASASLVSRPVQPPIENTQATPGGDTFSDEGIESNKP